MCSNVKSFEVGLLVHPAIMFMNSNKSESNIRQIIQQNRQKCSRAGIALMNETIVNKGPNRDIDRDAVNILITRLIGHDGGAVWDISRPSVCYPVRGQARASLIFSD